MIDKVKELVKEIKNEMRFRKLENKVKELQDKKRTVGIFEKEKIKDQKWLTE